VAISATVYGTASRLMSGKRPKRAKKGEPTERASKISLYGLSIEDALRAAAKTGRSPPLESQKPKRQQKKRTPKAPARE
jgi:hypothetical protein